MNIVSIIVVFAVVWFLALFCLLPVGIRSQEETGEDVHEGAMAGAPSDPGLRKKFIGATIISAVFTLIVWYLITWRVVTLDVLDKLFGLA